MSGHPIFVFVGIAIFWAFYGYLILAILKINKKIWYDTTDVETETARLIEIELRLREQAERIGS